MEEKPEAQSHVMMRIVGNVVGKSKLDKHLKARSRDKSDSHTRDVLVNALREIFQKADLVTNGDPSSNEYLQMECTVYIGAPGSPMDAKWKNIPFNANGWHLVVDENTKKQMASTDDPDVLELVQNGIHTKNGKTQACCSKVPGHIGSPLLCCPPVECTIKLALPIVDEKLLEALEPYVTVADRELLKMKRKSSQRKRAESEKGQPGEPKSKKAKRSSKRKREDDEDEADANGREVVIEVSEAKRRKMTKKEESNATGHEISSAAETWDSVWDNYTRNIG